MEQHILNEAAQQLREAVGTSLPLTPPGWSHEDCTALREVLDEVTVSDLLVAVRAAAERLPDDGED